MQQRTLDAVRQGLVVLHDDERGEVNASMISWMVVSAIVIFGIIGSLTGLLDGAIEFVRTTLGI